jgi:hypothetical protein
MKLSASVDLQGGGGCKECWFIRTPCPPEVVINETLWPHQVALGFGGPAFILLYPSVPVRLVEGLVG